VGDDNNVTGIVSERDLMRAISQCGAQVLKEPVSDFMTKTVVTARAADTIDRLMWEMTTHRFRHMPVGFPTDEYLLRENRPRPRW
jgi:CBS domain-containing protein